MKHEIRDIPGRGRVLWLTDDKTELGVALDLGIRILHLSCAGMEDLLYEQPDDLSDGLSTPDGWRIYGGHRYWTAPESEKSYYPDSVPVAYELTENGVRLTQQDDPWMQIRKRLDIEFMEDGSIELRHSAENISNMTVSYASWGVTTLDRGEARIGFRRGIPGTYAPSRSISLWGDSSPADPRIRFGEDEIFASHKPMENAFKMGIFSPDGRATLINKGQQFTLSFEAEKGADYPDGGCNFEVYMDLHVLELEALGQLRTLAPGERAEHWERWQVKPL
ncbi:MAG: hypothetical protein IJO88_04595 [Oscillospiraceae bacterium]|nr:hypothetical protein [Oscillospiraceae bacterium]